MTERSWGRCSNLSCFFHDHSFEIEQGSVQVCPLCHSEIIAEREANWWFNLAKNDENWIDQSEVDQWPSVIAYEYTQLRSLCNEEKPYGVLICLKDNFETLLKFETLLSFAWADRHVSDEFRANTICLLTTSNPSMGLWLELAGELIKQIKCTSIECLPNDIPLEKIRYAYAKNEIVNWRNNKIGHGALELSEDEEYRSEVLKMILLFRDILSSVNQELKQQNIYTSSQSLVGSANARGLEKEEEVLCRLEDTKENISLHPYVVIRCHDKRGYGVYFFDNQRTQTLTDFQAYAEGSWNKEENAYFHYLKGLLNQRGITFGASPDDLYLTEAENRELERLHMVHGFQNPQFICKWLKDSINSHDCGVFMLQMERGTGKSVLTDKLNRLYYKPLIIDEDLDVRTYHITRAQSAGIVDVRSRIQWLWASQYEGGYWQRVPRIDDFEKDNCSPSKAMARFLEEARNYSQRTRQRKKILMVFDGLDEISDDDIWTLLPRKEDLTKGIYVLFTSRNTETELLPEKIKQAIGNIEATDKKVVDRHSEEYVRFLADYIKQNTTGQFEKLTDDQKQKIIAKADYRILYLGLLCKMNETGYPFDYLMDVDQVVSAYIKMLDDCYGERESSRLREILAVLCTLGSMEPLSLKEIGCLTSEGCLSLKLIGMVRDLAPFLKTVRGEDVNRYTIANPDMAEVLAKQLPETFETVKGIFLLALSQIKQGWPLEISSSVVAIAHLAQLVVEWFPESNQIAALQEMKEPLCSYINNAKDHLDTIADRNRLVDYCMQSFTCYGYTNGLEDQGTLEQMQHLAFILSELGRSEQAILVLNSALEISKKIYDDEHPATLGLMSDCAFVLMQLRQYETALEIYEAVLKVYKKKLRPFHPLTIGIMNKMAFILRYMGRNEEAIDLLEPLFRGKDQLLSVMGPHDAAETLLNIGNLFSDLGEHEKALDSFHEARAYCYFMIGKEHPSTLTTRSEYANELIKMGRYKEALNELRETLTLHRKVLGSTHPWTINTMKRTVQVLKDLGKKKEATMMIQEIQRLESKKRR